MSRDHPGSRGDTGSKVATRLALLLCTDEEVHDLAEFWLTAAGIRVISASSAEDARREMLDKRIELLVLDTLPIYVPGLPGLLKLKQENQHLRVILIPRLDEKSEIGIARISGVDAVLARPLFKSKLLSVVHGLG
jgi:DNA-binding response OmpR family regulator